MKIRKLAEEQDWELQDFLSHEDLRVLNGRFNFDDNVLNFELQLVTEARVHDEDDLAMELSTKMIERPELTRFLIVQCAFWFAMYRRGSELFLYNCHPSPAGPAAGYNPEDPAAVIGITSPVEAAAAIRHFCFIQPNFKGFASVFSVNFPGRE